MKKVKIFSISYSLTNIHYCGRELTAQFETWLETFSKDSIVVKKIKMKTSDNGAFLIVTYVEI
jgi:hypothetical protein